MFWWALLVALLVAAAFVVLAIAYLFALGMLDKATRDYGGPYDD